MEQESNQSESSCTSKRHPELELPTETDFNQNSWPCMVLKLPRKPNAMLVFHWLWLTPTHRLLFIERGLYPLNACFSWVMAYIIGNGLHPCNACSPLVTAYTHKFLVSGNHFVGFIYGQMYLSTTSTGIITSQGDILHLVGVGGTLTPLQRIQSVYYRSHQEEPLVSNLFWTQEIYKIDKLFISVVFLIYF